MAMLIIGEKEAEPDCVLCKGSGKRYSEAKDKTLLCICKAVWAEQYKAKITRTADGGGIITWVE